VFCGLLGSQTDYVPDTPVCNALEINALLRLARQLRDDALPVLRVAILADTSSQLLAGALKGFARHLGYTLDLFEGEFDQIEAQALDPGSSLHEFRPETVIIYLAAEKIRVWFGTHAVSEREGFAQQFAERACGLHAALSASGCQVIFFNLADPGDAVFGNYGSKVLWSLQNQIRFCNQELARLAREADDFHVFDLAALQAGLGRNVLFDPKLYYTSKFALTPDALPLVARGLVQMLATRKGSFLKCIILDLDNTLWGGVVGDDGLERIQIGDLGIGPAFTAFQSWLKQLRDRGIVLAVCSKNDEANAREPFVKHPDMVLRLDDIAVFVANWEDKATNIRRIKSIIDVDYSAMMFLDDNPVERQLVRESFPTMKVPELPEDPSEYVSFLTGLDPFETASYTANDAQRTSEYQSEARRHHEREKFVNPADFLQSLEMRAAARPFSKFNIPRVTQLTQRSNQFNLRTVRYSEKEIAALANSPNHVTLAFELKDRFGDNGLISVIILERQDEAFFVDTWIMSCRVLGRGMEQLVLNTIVDTARREGIRRVIGEFLPTAKNGMVKDHYRKLGFRPEKEKLWVLECADYSELPVKIARESAQETADA
jgi:FkbH-like protein